MRISLQLAVRAGLVVLLAGVIGTITIRQNSIGSLKDEHQELTDESQEARRLMPENQEISRLRAEHQEAEKLREANQDLLKLRNEVRQLRREAESLESLKAENQRLLAERSRTGVSSIGTLPEDFLSRAALVDAGLDTPEATAQTFFWAMCLGNLERLSQTRLSLTDSLTSDPDEHRRQLVQQMTNFTGFRIAGKKIIAPDQVVLNLQSRIGGPVVTMKLQRVNNEWKVPPQ